VEVFKQLLDKARKKYAAVDRAVGGVLPGGVDSPYVGKSVDPEKSLKFLNNVIDAQAAVTANFGIPVVGYALNRIVDKPRPKENIPLAEGVRTLRKVQDRLPGGLQLSLASVPSGGSPSFTLKSGSGSINVVFEPQSSSGRGYETHAPTFLHELGHAMNFAQLPYSKAQQTIAKMYGRRPKEGDVAALSSYRGSTSEDRPLWLSGVEGALSELMAPGTRHTLAEEANATRRAFKLADEFGLPKGRGTLGAAYGSYLTSGLGAGFTEGLVGEIGDRAIEYLADFITDKVLDPALDKVRGSEYSPVEEKLRKYGYDENLYRLRQRGFGSPITIESK